KPPAPVPMGKPPVDLKVLYNGVEVPIRDGAVRAPKNNEEVSFVLVNRGDERYGVILKVNGENTLYREEGDPYQCHKWILGPGQELPVYGFQKQKVGSALGQDKAEKFRVLTREESEKDAVYYGPHAGTFTLVVFRELKGDKEVVTAASEV